MSVIKVDRRRFRPITDPRDRSILKTIDTAIEEFLQEIIDCGGKIITVQQTAEAYEGSAPYTRMLFADMMIVYKYPNNVR